MSQLQKRASTLLGVHFGRCTIRENYRPEWLIATSGGRLELDFYIEELSAGIEIQGIQHAQFVKIFHQNANGFAAQQQRDAEKKQRCEEHGIRLFYAWEERDLIQIIEYLSKRIPIDIDGVVPYPAYFIRAVGILRKAVRRKITKGTYSRLQKGFGMLLAGVSREGRFFSVDRQDQQVIQSAAALLKDPGIARRVASYTARTRPTV